jgi:LPXTG-motif cell wall-anchored protein
MDYTTIGLAAVAIIIAILYLRRRRARLSRDD